MDPRIDEQHYQSAPFDGDFHSQDKQAYFGSSTLRARDSHGSIAKKGQGWTCY